MWKKTTRLFSKKKGSSLSILRQVITEGHKSKHGGWCTSTPPNYVVPNVNFAEPYAQYPQPQQSVAIIGGYVARNAQNVAAKQANAAQLGEGNANISYELGRLHLVEPDEFVGGNVQPYYEQGYYYQDYQHQPPAED
jgi:hypothetical protein